MPSDEEEQMLAVDAMGMPVEVADVIEGFKLQAGNAAEAAAMNHAINKRLTKQLTEQADQISQLQQAVDALAAAQPEKEK